MRINSDRFFFFFKPIQFVPKENFPNEQTDEHFLMTFNISFKFKLNDVN